MHPVHHLDRALDLEEIEGTAGAERLGDDLVERVHELDDLPRLDALRDKGHLKDRCATVVRDRNRGGLVREGQAQGCAKRHRQPVEYLVADRSVRGRRRDRGCEQRRRHEAAAHEIELHDGFGELPGQHLVIGRAGYQNLEVDIAQGATALTEEAQMDAQRVVGAALELDRAALPAVRLGPGRLVPADRVGPGAVEGKDRRQAEGSAIAVNGEERLADLARIGVPEEQEVDRVAGGSREIGPRVGPERCGLGPEREADGSRRPREILLAPSHQRRERNGQDEDRRDLSHMHLPFQGFARVKSNSHAAAGGRRLCGGKSQLSQTVAQIKRWSAKGGACPLPAQGAHAVRATLVCTTVRRQDQLTGARSRAKPFCLACFARSDGLTL